MAHSGVSEVSEAIGGLIGLLENDSELRFEFRVRSASARRPVVQSHPIGRSAKLVGRLLGFFRLG